MSLSAVESQPPVVAESSNVVLDPGKNVDLDPGKKVSPPRYGETPVDFKSGWQAGSGWGEAPVDSPILYGPNSESVGVHQMIDIIGQIATSMRGLLTEAWRMQIVEVKARGHEAAKLALNSGLTTGVSSILGGTASFGFASAGIASLNPPHGRWNHSASSPTTTNTLDGKSVELRKLDIDTPFGDPRVVVARREADQWPQGKKTTIETDLIRKETAGQPSVVTFKQDVHSINYKKKAIEGQPRDADANGIDYQPTLVAGKTNTFRFEATDVKNKTTTVLGMKSNGELGTSELNAKGLPIETDFKPISYDGTGRYLVGGQEIARSGPGASMGPFNYQGHTVNGGDRPQLTFGATRSCDVHAAKLQAANTGMDGSSKPNRNVKDKFYYVLDEKGVEGIPKKVSIEGTGDKGHNLEMLKTTERYQSSQNWTQVGSSLQLMVKGVGETTSALFDQEKIETETDKEVASSRAGEIMQYRGDMSNTLSKAVQALEAIGNAETQAIMSA